MTGLDYLHPQLDKLEREGLLRRTLVSAGVGGKVLVGGWAHHPEFFLQ